MVTAFLFSAAATALGADPVDVREYVVLAAERDVRYWDQFRTVDEAVRDFEVWVDLTERKAA